MSNDEPEEFSEETEKAWEDVGAVLDAYNILESTLSTIIAVYISPRGRRKFTIDYVLHNTTIDFMKKARLIMKISAAVGGPTFNREHFQKFANTRNALAHGQTASGKRSRKHNETGKEEEYFILRIMNQKGEIEEKERRPAVREYYAILATLVEQVELLQKRVRI